MLFIGADVLVALHLAGAEAGRAAEPARRRAARDALAERRRGALARLPPGAARRRLGGDRPRRCWPSGSRCRRSRRARLLADHDRRHRDHARGRGLVAGRAPPRRRRGRGGPARDRGGVVATISSVAHLDSVVVWSALIAAALRYATPLTFAASAACSPSAAGREHRPRGDDADGRVLRHLGRRLVGLVGRRAASGDARRRAARARPRLLRDQPARRPDRVRHGDQLPRARDHGLRVHLRSTATTARPRTSRTSRT